MNIPCLQLMAIIGRLNGKTVNLAGVSKRQLALAYNERLAQIRQLEEHIQRMWQVLAAIVTEPEALRVDATCLSIDRAAIGRVEKGTQLHITQRTDRVELTRTPPEEAPVIETPRIVIPAGLG